MVALSIKVLSQWGHFNVKKLRRGNSTGFAVLKTFVLDVPSVVHFLIIFKSLHFCWKKHLESIWLSKNPSLSIKLTIYQMICCIILASLQINIKVGGKSLGSIVSVAMNLPFTCSRRSIQILWNDDAACFLLTKNEHDVRLTTWCCGLMKLKHGWCSKPTFVCAVDRRHQQQGENQSVQHVFERWGR